MKLYELDALIRAVAPIDGISFEGRIDFKPEATDAEKAAAQAIMDANIGSLSNA